MLGRRRFKKMPKIASIRASAFARGAPPIPPSTVRQSPAISRGSPERCFRLWQTGAETKVRGGDGFQPWVLDEWPRWVCWFTDPGTCVCFLESRSGVRAFPVLRSVLGRAHHYLERSKEGLGVYVGCRFGALTHAHSLIQFAAKGRGNGAMMLHPRGRQLAAARRNARASLRRLGAADVFVARLYGAFDVS